MKKIRICAILGFEEPCDCDIVVIGDSKPFIPEAAAIEHLSKAMKYARHYEVYVVSSRFIKDNTITQCLFSPKGELIGSQGACHNSLSYRGRLKRAQSIEILNSELGKIFIASDCDIFSAETIRAAALMGAKIVITGRHMELLNDTDHRVSVGPMNMALTNGIFVYDVTENGGRLLSPWSLGSKIPKPAFGKVDVLDMTRLKKEAVRPAEIINPGICVKYLNLLER